MPKKIKSNVEKIRSIPKDKPKKKYLRKNEFRMDLNKSHLNSKGKPHPTYITLRYGHKFRANVITHSRTINGVANYDIKENPDKENLQDTRQTRISPPFWQNEKLFGERLTNFKFSKQTRRYISKLNKKHK